MDLIDVGNPINFILLLEKIKAIDPMRPLVITVYKITKTHFPIHTAYSIGSLGTKRTDSPDPGAIAP